MHDKFVPKHGDTFGIISWFAEECSEAIAAAAKSLRFGLDSTNPLIPIEDRESNREWLLREIKDLEVAIIRLKMEILP